MHKRKKKLCHLDCAEYQKSWNWFFRVYSKSIEPIEQQNWKSKMTQIKNWLFTGDFHGLQPIRQRLNFSIYSIQRKNQEFKWSGKALEIPESFHKYLTNFQYNYLTFKKTVIWLMRACLDPNIKHFKM